MSNNIAFLSVPFVHFIQVLSCIGDNTSARVSGQIDSIRTTAEIIQQNLADLINENKELVQALEGSATMPTGYAVRKELYLKKRQMLKIAKDKLTQDIKSVCEQSDAAAELPDILIRYLEKHDKVLDSMTVKPPRTTYSLMKDMKQKLECVTFGYIRAMMEDEFHCMMPYYLKMICLQFYGNIIISSNILNANQTNIIGYALKSILNQNFFCAREMYRSKYDGFDANVFDEKCADLGNSLTVIKTNKNDIFSYFCSTQHGCAFILQTNVSTVPVLYDDRSYHFPNNFHLDVSRKLTDIFVENNNGEAIDGVGFLCKNHISDDMFAEEFEIFRL